MNHKNDRRTGIAIKRKIEASSYLHDELSLARRHLLRSNGWMAR
jgi:hypothetical protein